MKKVFAILFITGFILTLGTAGKSDLGTEIGKQLISDQQFYIQMSIGLGLLTVGGIGTAKKLNKNEGANCNGSVHLQNVSNNATVRNTYHTRTKAAHGKSQKRSAS